MADDHVDTNPQKKAKRSRARRGRGEHGVGQLANGLYYASVSAGFRPGRRDPRKLVRARSVVYGKTKREVLDKLAKLAAAGPEAVHRPDKITVASHLDRWLREVAATSVRANTLRSYTGAVDNHLRPHLGHHALAKLTASHVQSFLSDRLAANAGGRALQIALDVLRYALKNAVRLGLVATNVALDVERPSHEQRTIEYHTAEEMGRVLAKVPSKFPNFAALYELAYDSGARQGELFGAQWSDIDIANEASATWTMRHNLIEDAGELDLTELPKTKAGHRVIDLSARTARALKAHLDLRARRATEERERAERCEAKGDVETAKRARANAERIEKSGHVFTSDDGHALRKSNFLRRVHDPLMKAAKVTEITPHGTRHTCATLLLSRGVPPHVVARRLGHTDVATTLRIYAAVLPSQQRSAADAMGALMDEAATAASNAE